MTQSFPPTTHEKMGKFKASRIIVEESWGILKHNKDVMWLPVLSAITFLLVLGAVITIYVVLGGSVVEGWKNIEQSNASSIGYVGYLIFFAYYLIVIFIANFFQASIFSVVYARFNGINLSVGEGLNKSLQNVGKIFGWSLIVSTVGVVLQIIADKSEWVGKIVAGLLGSAWSILTYFSLPSLIIGQTTVKNSFKESAEVIRKTWGETIIIDLGVGLFFGLLVFAGMVIGAFAIMLVPPTSVAIGIAVILFLYIVFISILSSTLGSIFKLALYVYARTGVVPQGFSSAVICNAVKVK